MLRLFSTFSLLLTLMLAAIPAKATTAEDTEVVDYHVGVLANWGYQDAERRWQPLMDYLSQQLPNARFRVHPGTFNELNHALQAGQIQFLITNPGQYLYLSNQYPLSWLATMKSRQHNGTTKAIGSAIVVRQDSEIRTLFDLQNKTIAASDPHALGGYQATIGLLKQLGVDSTSWFKRVNFLGFPLDPLIYQVRDGNVDAAITPVCTLEQMSQRGLISADQYRVLNPSRPSGFECQCSTNLYPNWSFAASEKVQVDLTKRLTQALLALPAEHPAAIKAQLSGWTSPISQLQVIQLFDELQFTQANDNKWDQLYHWLKANDHWGVVAILLFVLATSYHFWIEYKFRQKSEALLASERQLKLNAIAMERLQSSAILGEIGAGLAHELNQPIAAISNYSEGGIMRAQAGRGTSDDHLALLKKIQSQSQRASEVVQRIRGLLKRREAVMSDVNLLSLVDEALALLNVELTRRQIEVRTQVEGEPFFISGDRVGLLQVLVNILKNSIDALDECPAPHHGQLLVQFQFLAEQVNLAVIDNGPGLALESDALMATFFSTKADGLGLGLAICNDIIKQHQGLFTLQQRDDGQLGCQAQLKLRRRGSQQPVH
ncbi:sensor histidine kinase [Ferrimonas senticii]|uniref:sensor histidine kinase n=1 Tax=Ferrimonas senticii TaxID=394566 RepID=UPI00041A5FA7|nr:sensor histidine kinase [Ferrimonas senticii]